MALLFSRNLSVHFCVEYTPHAVVMGLQLSIGGKGLEVYFIVCLCTMYVPTYKSTNDMYKKERCLNHSLTNVNNFFF